MLFLFALPFCHSLPLKYKRGRMFCWQTSGIRMKVCCCRCLLSHHRSMRILYAFLCVCCMRTTARYILCCSIPIHMIICIFDIHFVCRCVNESNAAKERWTTSSNQWQHDSFQLLLSQHGTAVADFLCPLFVSFVCCLHVKLNIFSLYKYIYGFIWRVS